MDCHWHFYAASKGDKKNGGSPAFVTFVLPDYRKSVPEKYCGKTEALLEKSGGRNAYFDS